MPLHTHVERGSDKVQRTEQLADTEKENRTCPQDHAQALTRAGNRAHRAEWRVLRPAAQSRPITYKERRNQNQEGYERNPERHHVEVGERHILRAHLDGQKEITECRERGRGEHKKDHDRAVHGHQLQIILRRHYVTRSAVLRKQVQTGNGEIGESQMEAHEPGEKHSDENRDQCQRIILFADDFVVEC